MTERAKVSVCASRHDTLGLLTEADHAGRLGVEVVRTAKKKLGARSILQTSVGLQRSGRQRKSLRNTNAVTVADNAR